MLSLNDFKRKELLERGFSEEEIKKSEALINRYIHRSYPYWVKGYLIVEKIFREELDVTSDVIEEISQKKDDPKCLTFDYLLHTRTALALGLFREAVILARTTLEVALKDKISEKYAKQNTKNSKEFHDLYLEKMEELNNNPGMTLGNLYPMAEGKNWKILPKGTFEKEFQELGGLDILNKFVHGDVLWLAKFIEKDLVGMPINIMNANNEYERRRQIAEFYGELFSPLPFEIFRATCRILKKLYFEENTKDRE